MHVLALIALLSQAPAAAAAPSCKTYRSGKCCDPAVTAHLAKEAVFAACGESETTFLGESASKDTCKYVFKVEGAREEESFVQVYVPAQKEPPAMPTDPFFRWKRIGKVYVTDKAASPKSAPMLAAGTGLYLAGKDYTVSVNASTKVCTKQEAQRLAKSMK